MGKSTSQNTELPPDSWLWSQKWTAVLIGTLIDKTTTQLKRRVFDRPWKWHFFVMVNPDANHVPPKLIYGTRLAISKISILTCSHRSVTILSNHVPVAICFSHMHHLHYYRTYRLMSFVGRPDTHSDLCAMLKNVLVLLIMRITSPFSLTNHMLSKLPDQATCTP